MRIPKKIKVGSHQVPVKLVPQSELLEKDGTELEGEFDNSAMVIKILKTLPLSKKRTILYHEVTHAAIHPTEVANEEAVVNISAERMVPVLRENPRLVEFLVSEKPRPKKEG